MVKGGIPIENKRVLVSGTGPLLPAVADFLKARGATVLAVIEQAPAACIRRFATGLWRYPAKVAQAVVVRMRLGGVPYITNSFVTAAAGDGKVEEVTITGKGKTWNVECDYLACGFHLIPNSELASLLGCRLASGFVEVDENQRTSIENVYCAGEPTGIGGVEASLIEGRIAGLSVTGQIDAARRLFGLRSRTRRFTDLTNKTFALRSELRTLAADTTIVCRCEDVEYGRLTEFNSFRDAKLQARCGMGPCQGRICGAVTEFLFGWEPPSVRPPLFPVKMEDL
jgi:NADPH-dependent 2,4-dienoyl-CoA reductase/sulfur reductase-like enzyme